jgi:hypothetical protein
MSRAALSALAGLALVIVGCSAGGQIALPSGSDFPDLSSLFPTGPGATPGAMITPTTIDGSFTIVDDQHVKTTLVDSKSSWTLTINVKLQLDGGEAPGGGGLYKDAGSTYTSTGYEHQEVVVPDACTTVEDKDFNGSGALTDDGSRGATAKLDFDYGENGWFLYLTAGVYEAFGSHTGMSSCYDEYEPGAKAALPGFPGVTDCAVPADGTNTFVIEKSCMVRTPDTWTSLSGTLTGH